MRTNGILKIISVIGFLIVAVGIFFLTTQDQTSTIKTTELAIRLFPRTFQLPQYGGSAETFSFARRIAHIFEFGLLGVFAAICMIIYNKIKIKKRILTACLICFTYSLFDQIHKIFVPGREFDVRDLGFDALGYLTAIFLSFGFYLAATHYKNKKANL